MHGKSYIGILRIIIIFSVSALIDGIVNNDAFKHVKHEEKQESWTLLLKEFRIYETDTDPVNHLRRRLVLGASEWLSGKNG